MFKREKQGRFCSRSVTTHDPVDTSGWTRWQKLTRSTTKPRELRYYRFWAGTLVCDREYSDAEYSQLTDYQGRTPVNLMTIGEKKWWWFRNVFYVEDEGLDATHVKALVVSAEEKRKRRLDRAVTIASIAE